MDRLRVVVLLIILFVAGCTGPANPSDPLLRTQPETQADVSPLVTHSPLVLPTSTPHGPIPTYDPALGRIEGTIAMDGQLPGILPAELYLGDPTGAQPVGAYISLDATSAPRGYVKPDGSFVFPNVASGTYVILVWTPQGAYPVPDPETGYTWLIEITGTEVFNTGHIQVPNGGQ